MKHIWDLDPEYLLSSPILSRDEVAALQAYARTCRDMFKNSTVFNTQFVIDDFQLERVGSTKSDYLDFYKRKASAEFGVEMCKKLTWEERRNDSSFGGFTSFHVSATVWPETLREEQVTP